MAELERKGQDARFCEIMQRIGHLYEEYAKSKGMTYMSMCILEAICTTPDNCTQKCICEETHYPKQSVNLIVKSFWQAGYITLEEMPADRRNKRIILTEKGQDYAARTVPPPVEDRRGGHPVPHRRPARGSAAVAVRLRRRL